MSDQSSRVEVTVDNVSWYLKNSPKFFWEPRHEQDQRELELFVEWMNKQEKPYKMDDLYNYRNIERMIRFAEGWRPKQVLRQLES